MKNTISKRLAALCMAFAMMFSLLTVVHADPVVNDGLSKPTTHTEVAKPATVTSITVGSATAYYETDDNTGSTTYIRAQLTGKTEYDLKSVTVTVNLADSDTAVALDGTAINGDTTARSFTTDLLNKAHTLTIGGADYVLAAGLPSGRVSISSDDPLSLGTVTMGGTSMDVYGANVQNPCMGNTYYVNRNQDWTFVNYFISGTVANLSSVETTYTLKSGASISGAGATNVTATSYTFNFNVGNILTVTNGTESRDYDAELAIAGQNVIVQEDEDGNRNYDINFSEVKASDYYVGDVKKHVDEIVTAWEAYISQPHTFNAGTSVMAVLQAFDTWATQTENPVTEDYYFTGASDFGGGTYLSKLNNLNWNDCGNLAGYMYTNDANGYYWTAADNHSTIPSVGAADMVFTSSTRIVWFYTVNYWNWF